MIDIDNKQERKALIERYLEADTTVAEERALAEYYAMNQPDADEAAFAKLVLTGSAALNSLSNNGEREYDRLIESRHRIGLKRTMRWVAGIAAAVAVVAIVRASIVSYIDNQRAITPIEIANTLNMMMSLSADEIESITATPCGKNVLITTKMKDNSSSTYILTRDGDALTTYFAWRNQ